jgi:hypothetical protein
VRVCVCVCGVQYEENVCSLICTNPSAIRFSQWYAHRVISIISVEFQSEGILYSHGTATVCSYSL